MASAQSRLRAVVEAEQQRLATGERRLYHVMCTAAAGGAFDVTVRELPTIHLFVPDRATALDGARLLIAQTLATDLNTIDLALEDPSSQP